MLFPLVLEHSSSAILPLLRACKTIRDLNQVHTHIIRRGCEQDHYLIAQFISICTTVLPTNVSYPTGVFDCVTCPNIYLWNILMKAHCENSSLDECFSLFSRMRRAVNVVPDKYTFPSLIKACSNYLALREGRLVHGVAVRCGTEGDVFVGSSLVDLYGKCEEIECARRVFDGMSVRNEVSWTAMMVGLLNIGDIYAARCLFDEMPQRNEATWNAMIKGLVKLGDLKSARKVFDVMPSRNEVSFTTLIDGYAKAGDMVAASSLFDELPQKDLVSWSALMSGYVENGKPGEALKVFSQMWAMNVKPDEFVLVSLMSACSQLGSLELAKWIESYMSNESFDLRRAHVAAALVDMNAKCGNMERATLLFKEMPKRDLISYCSMIQGLCIHSRGPQAVLLFDRMIDEGIRPDDVAFTVILTACSHAGLVDDGCRLFDLMVHKYSIRPSPDHYACMVNLLGKSGKVQAAYELIQSTPVETHAGAWGALLGACRLHGDIDLGEVVAHRLFELEPHNAGNYVLLSNIYAEADRWLNVFHLRGRMSERGVRKIPGCSYVESTTPT
ncbi:putative pentatricopeptide repeat-containing protein At5g37570 isoform X1 [Sesamum indicum]|uniref:Pentatricopeptide repeat-containing protein At5g37570 isoform X1 n=1 Tax=Sesamum indicum TaxID=4182 RepID=A0A6I9UPP5_SESIN|nr:putative pentatricopeptide repeat-containing protein At5g37570 isoform X1 [Sesamum indicum]